MKKIYYLVAVLACMSMTSCGDGFNFPEVEAETDLYKIPLPETSLVEIESKDISVAMDHVGGLHTEEDFERIREKLKAGESPWVEGYEVLKNSKYAQLSFQTYPTEIIVRGGGSGENYMNAARGAAAAYQLALRWKIEEKWSICKKGSRDSE